MKELTYFNGEFVEPNTACVQLQDRGYNFGDGVYEVTRVYKGRPFALSYHQDRLYRSMRETDIPVKMPPDEFVELHEVLIEQSEIEDGYIYLQVTRGVAPRSHGYDGSSLEPQYFLFIKPFPSFFEEVQTGVKAITLEDERWLRCDIKSLNLLPNIMAQAKADKKFAYGAILFRDDICTEGNASNVFVVKDRILYTHPADNLILKGITRQLVIGKVAPSCGVTVIEKEFDRTFVEDADEIFFTDTLGGIVPVTKLDRNAVGSGEVGSVTKRLQERYASLLSEGLA